MNHYADTAKEAIRLVRDEMGFGDEEIEGANASPDPHVDHVWLVVLADGSRFVAYTSGHHVPALRGAVEELGPCGP